MPDGLKQPMGTAQSTSMQGTSNQQVLPSQQPNSWAGEGWEKNQGEKVL